MHCFLNLVLILAISQILVSKYSFAQNQNSPLVITLPEIRLDQNRNSIPFRSFNKDQIISGKKTTVIDSTEFQTLPSTNARQSLAQVPGLMISEVNNESYSSITFRGLGDPHESFNLLQLRNGIPISPDPYGYPAAYYQPAPGSIEQTEFHRGGASLLFGPQPAGALNYILRGPPKKIQNRQFLTQHTAGSFGRYSTYNEYSVNSGTSSHLVSYHSRHVQGFRSANSDNHVVVPRWIGIFNLGEQFKLSLDIEMFAAQFGESGGLAKEGGVGHASFQNAKEVSTPNDRLKITRQAMDLVLTQSRDQGDSMTYRFWISEFDRISYRQALGGSGFGRIATGSTNSIQDQAFSTQGYQIQWLNPYEWLDSSHRLQMSLQSIHTESPYNQYTGAFPTARDGPKNRGLDRRNLATSFSVENLFDFSGLKITPSIRHEIIEQKSEEIFNSGPSSALKSANLTTAVSLMALAAETQIWDTYTLYSHYAQGFKPASFGDSLPLAASDVINENLKEARTQTLELGLKSMAENWAWDVSVYQIKYSNLIGRSGNQIINAGESHSEGLDLLAHFQLNPALRFFVAPSILKAQFQNGAQQGKTPQYSPAQIIRAGAIYNLDEKSKIRLQTQNLADHFGDDANSEAYHLKGYTVWDFSGEYQIASFSSIHFGIQNIQDQTSPSRVRSQGFEPTSPRNFYVGFKGVFE